MKALPAQTNCPGAFHYIRKCAVPNGPADSQLDFLLSCISPAGSVLRRAVFRADRREHVVARVPLHRVFLIAP